MTLNPMLGSKIEYLWTAHSKPWRLSVGRIGRAKIEDNSIRVGFTVSLREAMMDPRWDAENNRVFIEVLDADNRTVMDNWLEFKDAKVITASLCLGETNV